MVYEQVEGSIPSQISTYFASQINILDDYVLVKVGDNEYVGIIECKLYKDVYKFTRSGSYNSSFSVSIDSDSEDTIEVKYPVYCISSQRGEGFRVEAPRVQDTADFALCFILGLLCFAILFKGVMFKCLRKRRY